MKRKRVTGNRGLEGGGERLTGATDLAELITMKGISIFRAKTKTRTFHASVLSAQTEKISSVMPSPLGQGKHPGKEKVEEDLRKWGED